MMNNLFSIFDPSSSLFLPFNWISLIMFSVMIIPAFWVKISPVYYVLSSTFKAMTNEFSILLKSNKMNILLFISLFALIIFNNTLGLISFSFTSTSHLAITLSLALPLWLGFIIFSIFNNTLLFLAHLVPLGTPAPLMPFMVLIEMVSNVIRPITLSVRLAANMIAGHLLLTLLGSQLVSSSYSIFIFIFSAQFLLTTLESAVACIQAYVFSVLTTLYASEA